jgi:hypothetical protein
LKWLRGFYELRGATSLQKKCISKKGRLMAGNGGGLGFFGVVGAIVVAVLILMFV